MKRSIIKPYAALLALLALFSGCSGPAENPAASNANANSNSSQAPVASEAGTPLTVQPVPPPAKAADDVAKPTEKSPVGAAANASTAGNARAPKLVAPDKKLDFGKQPQDKTLIRAIAIRNGGRADLNIESIVPS
jgi:hypothetical protein